MKGRFSYKLLRRLPSSVGAEFLPLESFLETLTSKRLVWFGEYHSETRVTWLLEKVVRSMVDTKRNACDTGGGTNGSCSKQPHDGGAGSSKQSLGPKLHVILEHFSLEMQDILQQYQSKTIDWGQMIEKYKEIGTEAHDLSPYKDFFEFCRSEAERVHLHGGFIPRPLASGYMKAKSPEEKAELFRVLSSEKGYLPPVDVLDKIRGDSTLIGEPANPSPDLSTTVERTDLPASRAHFALFESMMTGRDIYGLDDPDAEGAASDETDDSKTSPNYTQYGKIFQAQLLKDWAMAWYIFRQMKDNFPEGSQCLVVAGRAHMQHYQGVPEILRWIVESRSGAPRELERTQLMVLSQMMFEVDLDDNDQKRDSALVEQAISVSPLINACMQFSGVSQKSVFKKPIADVLYVYDEDDTHFLESSEKIPSSCVTHHESGKDNSDVEEGVKHETAVAYNRVGETADRVGNAKKAKAILSYLGYTTEQQAVIGESDIYNYQGVGNPFRMVDIKPGHRVLDLGSGLGVDSFLAAHYAGPEGRVLGVDIAKKEVKHAQGRAEKRKIADRVRFQYADIEKLSEHLRKEHFLLELPAFDIAISNGAFCLAPNKRKAFEQVYQVLKPGGRMAICTTTVRKDLDVETQWPVCMRMFVHLDKLKPMCEEIGFKDVIIDLEDADLEFELEGVDEKDMTDAGDASGRNKMHVGSEEFKHLANYNMNELCARVVVCGTK